MTEDKQERSREQIRQVLREQKIAFADAETEAAFLAGVADETGEGNPFYVPTSTSGAPGFFPCRFPHRIFQ